jgi:hypothetical protein
VGRRRSPGAGAGEPPPEVLAPTSRLSRC